MALVSPANLRDLKLWICPHQQQPADVFSTSRPPAINHLLKLGRISEFSIYLLPSNSHRIHDIGTLYKSGSQILIEK